MRITVLGAAGGEVTGAAYLVETRQAAVLIDCGLFQGHHVEALNRPPVGTGSARRDAVVLTHAHLDHTGRLLVEGAKQVTIFGETVAVNAQVHTLGGFSAHAGQTDLAAWFVTLAPSRPRVILTHGENGPRAALAGLIEKTYGLTPVLPALGDIIEV